MWMILAQTEADYRAAVAGDTSSWIIKLVIAGFGLLAILLGVLGMVIRSATKDRRSSAPSHARASRSSLQNELDAALAKSPGWTKPALAPPFGPTRYRISGVDREFKMDTTGYYTADSEANARVKAELDGMVVTSVIRA